MNTILKSLLRAYKRRRRKKLFLRIYFERLRHPGQDMDSVFGDTCSDFKSIAEKLDCKEECKTDNATYRPDEEWREIIRMVKKGGAPGLTGAPLSPKQGEELRALIGTAGVDDGYIHLVLETRYPG